MTNINKPSESMLIFEEKFWALSFVISLFLLLFFIWLTVINPHDKIWELCILIFVFGFFSWYLAFQRTAVFDKDSESLKFYVKRIGWNKSYTYSLSDISSIQVTEEPSDVSGAFYKTVVMLKKSPPLPLTFLGFYGKEKHEYFAQTINDFLNDHEN